jgi:hypothetical protein
LPHASLYDLSKEGIEISELLTDSLGELTEEIEQRLDVLMLQGPDTLEAAAMVVKQLEAGATACEDESKRLRERAKAFQENAEKLKQRMTVALDLAFSGKIRTSLFSVWTQKSADRTIADLVPGVTAEMLHKERPDLVRVKMELDREKCVADFKAHQRLPEYVLFQEKKGERYVRIR